MNRYRIELLDAAGTLASQHAGLFGSDNQAIDHAGWLDHAHALRVWRSGRLVAEFAPVRRLRAHTACYGRLSNSDLKLLRVAMAAIECDFEPVGPRTSVSSDTFDAVTPSGEVRGSFPD